jgi:hypothetical protein
MKKTLIDHHDITRRDAMKGGIGAASLAALGSGAGAPVAISAASVVATTDQRMRNRPPHLRQSRSLLRAS